MRIVVLVGRVLDPAGIAVNRRVGRIFVNREEYLMQPADRCALEAALRIKDGAGDTELIALPRSPLPDGDVLRQALAAGADRAIALAGEGLEAADEAAMAQLLAAAVQQLGDVDLVVSGSITLDTGQAQLGPRLAEALGWPQIVSAWVVKVAEGRVEAVRREGDGHVLVEADLPALVTFVPGALKPRYPDGSRLITVYRDEGAVETMDVVDLLDGDAPQPVLEKRGQDFPPQRELGVRVGGSVEEMAQTLADALRKRVRV